MKINLLGFVYIYIKKEYLYKSKTQTKCFKVDCLRVIFYFTYAFSIIIVKYQNLHNKNLNNFASREAAKKKFFT